MIPILTVSLICLYSLTIWWPTRVLPYHWDSAAFFINAVKFLYDHHFSPLIAPYSEFAHPPLLQALTALVWQIFGASFLTSHLVMLPFLPVLLLSTYYLGKKIGGLPVAMFSTLLVAVTPFVLAEYGMPYIDLPAGSLAALSLTLWVFQKPKWAITALSLAVLIKFTVILLLPMYIFDIMKKSKSFRPKLYILLIIPCFLVTAWLLYHHSVTGWWLTIPGRQTVLKATPLAYFNSLKFVLYVFFIRQYRIVLTLFAAVAFLLRYRKINQAITPPVKLLLFAMFFCLVSFALTGEFIPRYGIFLLPAFTVVSVYFIFLVFPKYHSWLAIIGIASLFISVWHPRVSPTTEYEFRLNEDLSYQDHIAVGLQAARYLETQYPNATIYGGFPQNYQLTQSWQGYITHPLKFKDCSQYSANDIQNTIFYIHPYHNSQIACQTLVHQLPVKIVQAFLVNGKWAQIYALETFVPVAKSSTTKP